MSRTYRRTSGEDRNFKRRWMETRESFEELQEEYLSMTWKTSYVSTWDGRTRHTKWFHHEVAHYRDYEQYEAAIKARYHADRSWYGCGVPRFFRNMCCERPFRAAHKEALQLGWKTGDWEAVTLKPFIRDAAWLYW